ncbi:DUF397 domain-containing protein [Streptomyces boluensis]|uniref:DUF397 domain-containing protein n=1 Tax=Streptomyces boluensis TaxID=1775135 RepID=A0A964XPW1_9ACTN|nr:DUF397 domain-containing protein [Streptomyces boluensis]NBE55192.1 DUF397 domain-containing protein [Streptomyces boluensis]
MTTEELAWFKSSYSGGEGGECLEVAYDWRKSTYSGGGGGECVEVTTCTCPAPTVHIRDSKNPAYPHLDASADAWSAFLTYATR